MKTKFIPVSILLTSFLILFLELILIRIIPSYVIHISFYTNFILIACFLGIGVGLLLNKNIKDFSPYHLLLLLIFLVTVTITSLGPNTNVTESPFLKKTYGFHLFPQGLVIGTIFLFVTLLFIPFGQKLRKLFFESKNILKAYSLDLLGSIIGIATFFVFSLFSIPPIIWFTFFSVVFLTNIYIQDKKIPVIQIFLSTLFVIYIFFVTKNSLWSPYYKIDVASRDAKFSQTIQSDTIFVNGIWHQNLVKPEQNKEDIYFSPYRYVQKSNYDDILIIGSGGGNDIAVALTQDVKHIDAVEIDPKIIILGQTLHPSAPYADQRVNTVINDGRNYLHKTNKQYDMIVFALTDSLTLVSGQSGIRLESYLFTKESFKLAYDHLKDDGIVVLYNYYKHDWILQKLGASLESTFHQTPYVVVDEANPTLASFIISKNSLELREHAPPNHYITNTLPIATDDWPFFYLEKRSIPFSYVYAILAVLVFSILLIRLTIRLSNKTRPSFHFPLFFTGAAFMLLETSALAKFALLFGSTWIVNCFVFLGILSTALFANSIAAKYKNQLNKTVCFALLFASLFLYYLFPFTWLLGTNIYIRYSIGILISIGPVFFAGLTFSNIFSDTKKPHIALGSNLLGAMVGGILEYVALITGYGFLIILSFILYMTAIILHKKSTSNNK